MSQYNSVFGDVDWVAYYKKRKPDLTEIKDGINDIKQSIANLECGGSGGGNTYAHKVEIKFDNFSLSYYGQEYNHDICSFNFNEIANNSIGRNDISVSGDLQELLNFYPIMQSPNSEKPSYSKEFKTACHVYLKDADTENVVKGIGICGSTSEGSREVGILFNKGTHDKFFTNTVIIEWGLEVSSGGGSGGSSQTIVQELSVTANGTYNAGDNAAYNPVTVNVSSGGGEDKLLCYYMYNGRTNGCVVYTDKPATKINYGDVTGAVSELLPCDGGKHLFFTNTDLTLYNANDSQALCQLVYEDGTKISLKGKFINA